MWTLKCAIPRANCAAAGLTSIAGGYLEVMKYFAPVLNCRKFLVSVLLVSLTGITSAESTKGETAWRPPRMAREFRAAWIATVANIDWPSKPGLSTSAQQQELIALYDKAAAMNLNAVVLQVRPACDALYASPLEPWSEYLTGAMGRPPAPYYDPLEFAVTEAHRRGLQLHAWFNPYRAGHPSAKSSYSADHVSKTMPGAVAEYGDYLWLDPSNAAAEQHTLDVILDVVRRYDVDGVHFDDYFYPYPIDVPQEKGPAEASAAEGALDGASEDDAENGAEKQPLPKVPFPDEESWREYQASTAKAEQLSRDDWRRGHVNRLIRRVQEGVHREKPWVLFGVSPFGIWRPGHPESIQGFDAYASLYADSKLWLEEGWVDYFTPQLYWSIRSKGQSYPVLLDWWRRQNAHDRHLWPGLFTSRLQAKTQKGEGWTALEIIEQVRLTQGATGASGNIHFSMKALAQNRDHIADALREGPYLRPAVVPETTWLAADTPPPRQPTIGWRGGANDRVFTWQAAPGADVWVWGVQEQLAGKWSEKIIPGSRRRIALQPNSERVALTAFDRLGRASKPLVLPIPRDETNPL